MFISIGGGELRKMTAINDMIADKLAYIRINKGRKPYILFLPTASSESKPYINSFNKEFGSRLKFKTKCAIWLKNEMSYEHIKDKFEKCDAIYIGGGKYDVLMREWIKMGIKDLLADAIASEVAVIGNSAGAMILYENAVSDYLRNESEEYITVEGYGFLKGTFCPHADEETRVNYVKNKGIENITYLKEYEYVIYE